MTYQPSLLSVYPPPPSNNKGQDFISQFEEELPATAPVFEGHLYLRTDKKQWQWRLFRFDGTCFTCLSTRKVKLPPNTRVDAPSDEPTTSFTSPLLATPKKSRQQSTTTPLAKYYQLPKWTVEISNISAVSVLKPRRKLTVPPQAKCFCVRTFDGHCYIMKAQKQKDLERWLFVLTKMWKFAQAMKLQLVSQQEQQPIRHSHHHHHHQTRQHQQRQQQQQQLRSQDSIPLSHIYQRPRHISLENSNIAEHSLPMMIKSQAASSPQLPTSSIYDKQYHHPILSAEKSNCIDAWRQSLCELMSVDPQLQLSTPPPIESIPEDDHISVISDMTSISHRKPTSLRRRASSKRSIKMKSRDAPPQLKKKRSNDVKNWIEPRKTDNNNTLTAGIDTYQVNYFQQQDAKTTGTVSSLDLDRPDDKRTVLLDRHAKYHESTRAKQIQIVDPDTTSNQPSMDTRNPPILLSSIMTPFENSKTQDHKDDDEEEEMSLADLQRSLKRASLQHHTNDITPFSSSTSLLPERHQMYYSQLPTPLTAPAIPPFTISRVSLGYHDTKDVYRHRNKPIDQDQLKSCVPSCDQQKVIQHRRSIPLDTVQ